ncbi:MAG: short-chain dehydrogenase, partial [Mycobacterium sp.]
TPALRQLEHSRGQISSPDEVPADAATVEDVIAEAFENLSNGPTLMVGATMRAAAQMLASLTRNQVVELFTQASSAAMAPDR